MENSKMYEKWCTTVVGPNSSLQEVWGGPSELFCGGLFSSIYGSRRISDSLARKYLHNPPITLSKSYGGEEGLK